GISTITVKRDWLIAKAWLRREISMNPERWKQINDVLISALEREPFDLPAVVKAACEGDERLRVEVETLLASHEQAGDFLEESIVGAAARLLVGGCTHLVGGAVAHVSQA